MLLLKNLNFTQQFIRKITNLNPPKDKKITFYEILQLPTNSSAKEIKSQYYKLSKLLHPDLKLSKSKSNSTHDNDNDNKFDFNDISRAYETLKDAKKRREYDRTLENRERKRFLKASHSTEQNFEADPSFHSSVNNSKTFWSKIDEKKFEDNLERERNLVSKRLEDNQIFYNRILIIGSVLIVYLFSTFK